MLNRGGREEGGGRRREGEEGGGFFRRWVFPSALNSNRKRVKVELRNF